MIRRLIRRLPLLLFAALLGVPAAARTAEEALDLDAQLGTHWYGIYMLDRKVGYARVTTELGEHDGTRVLSETMHLSELVLLEGRRLLTRLEFREAYEADPPYRLILAERGERTSETTSHLLAERNGDDFVVTCLRHGRTTTQRVPASKAGLRDRWAVERFVSAGARPGETVTYLEFDKNRLADVEHTATLAEVLDQDWAGQHRPVFVVEDRGPETTVTERCLDDGTLIAASFGETIQLKLEDEAEARRMPAVAELLELRRKIPFETEIRKPESLAELKLTIIGMPEGMMPELPTQQVEKRDDGAAVVTLTRSAVPAEPSVTDEDRERLAKDLEATDEVQADDKRLRAWAARIVGRRHGPLKQARAICRWVHRHVEAETFTNYDTALDVLIHLKGDCTEHALLFVGLCRAAGLPARRVSGLVYAGPAERAFGMHAWAEVYVGRWVDVDPTLNQFPADATHIRLDTEGGRWFALLAAFDSIRIKQISAE